MDIQQTEAIRDPTVNNRRNEELTKKQDQPQPQAQRQQLLQVQSPPRPSSQTSSPSHEFSFTISLHSSSSTPTPLDKKTKIPPPPSSFAIDLSPADDIFFHGHLLPLHLLSHLPLSPRSSVNSIDNSTLPVKDDQKPNQNNQTFNNPVTNNEEMNHNHNNLEYSNKRTKQKPFFFFKWRKATANEGSNEDKEKAKKKLRFDMTQVLKKYMKMVRPLLFFKDRRKETSNHLRRHTYSYSGNLSAKNRFELRGRRGGLFSAPASMRTSPTNSGHLLANTAGISLTPTSTTSESTMEELQAAIQAAIAHCKNSIANEDKKINSLSS